MCLSILKLLSIRGAFVRHFLQALRSLARSLMREGEWERKTKRRGLAQSKTLSRGSIALKNGEAFGLRQSSGAFNSAHSQCF